MGQLALREFTPPLRTKKTFEDRIGGGSESYDVFAVDTGEKIGDINHSGTARWTYTHRGQTKARGWGAKPTRFDALWALAQDEQAWRRRQQVDAGQN